MVEVRPGAATRLTAIIRDGFRQRVRGQHFRVRAIATAQDTPLFRVFGVGSKTFVDGDVTFYITVRLCPLAVCARTDYFALDMLSCKVALRDPDFFDRALLPEQTEFLVEIGTDPRFATVSQKLRIEPCYDGYALMPLEL